MRSQRYLLHYSSWPGWFISSDSTYGKSPSVKHMVLSTSKGVNPFFGLTVMRSSDDSITEKDLKLE